MFKKLLYTLGAKKMSPLSIECMFFFNFELMYIYLSICHNNAVQFYF